MRHAKLFIFSMFIGIYSIINAQAAQLVSPEDIDKAVSLSASTNKEFCRLKLSLTYAARYEISEEDFEAVKPSKSIVTSFTTSVEEKAAHSRILLNRLRVSFPLMLDGSYGDFSNISIHEIYSQLTRASVMIDRDIIESLNRLSFVLSSHEGIKNSDENGRLTRINALIRKWARATKETRTAADFLDQNYGLSVL